MGTSARLKRLISLTGFLAAHPREQISLTDLSRRFGVAKSTVSEDLLVIKDAVEASGLGVIETQVGVQGGLFWQPALNPAEAQAALDRWAEALASPDRRTAEGFLYMTDLLFNPRDLDPMGALFAERFRDLAVDWVATMETKGIPLALATARELGVGVVLIRRDSRLSEGSALSINYLSGSSHRIQSMSLARRMAVQGSRGIFVDDFMKAGGTAKAATDLLAEFDAAVVAVGVLIATREPARKLVSDYIALLEWEEATGAVRPSPWTRRRLVSEIRER